MTRSELVSIAIGFGIVLLVFDIGAGILILIKALL